MNQVYLGDNLEILRDNISDQSIDLIYIDPPFNTGKSQTKQIKKYIQDDDGERIGFQGKKYKVITLPDNSQNSYGDIFEDKKSYMEFLKPRLIHAHRVLKKTGTLYFHIDYREVHRCRILLDSIFGEENFQNEIIWAYDYGGRSKKRWPAKHDNILVYSKNADQVYSNKDEIKKINFKAPNGGNTKKINPSDAWWHTIVPTNSKQRTGYPTQKPLGILNRIISVSSKPGDTVLDFFAGSGTTGESAYKLERKFILIDSNLQSIDIMQKRFKVFSTEIDWRI